MDDRLVKLGGTTKVNLRVASPFFYGGDINDRSRIVREHARHRRQVAARVPPDREEPAHGLEARASKVDGPAWKLSAPKGQFGVQLRPNGRIGSRIGLKEKTMGSEWIIGALAFMTIGSVLALSIFHFAFYLKDPANMAAAKSVAEDRESAATRVSTEGVNGRSLRQRLDDAPALKDRLSNRYVGSISINDLLNSKWSSLKMSS